MSKSTTAEARRNNSTKDTHELDSNIVKALSHPLRMRILTRLNEGVASPNEMAKEFEESLPLVSYHVRILRELECIELVRTTPRRGAIEHHYRALTRPFLDDDDWAQLPPSARKAVSNTVLSKALSDVRNAVAAGTFDDRADRHLSYTSLLLDEQGWRALGDRLNELLDWAIEEQAASAGRLQDDESGGPEVRGRLTLLGYSAPPAGTEDASAAPKRRRAKR
ncbi:MAG: transcriptional regulator, ArsR family [Conexibacter sp.]|nr:transcriptional regulator, ArsR family [Conexibacter sp.]